VHEKSAPKKSVASATEDLTIALAEGLCTPKEILEVYTPDERVRHLEANKLWTFITEGAFWLTRPEDTAQGRAVNRMTFTLERALAEGLIKLEDMGDGMSFKEIAKRLPIGELQKAVEHAMTIGRTGKPLTEKALLEAIPLIALTGYVPLDHTWQKVVVAKIAGPSASRRHQGQGGRCSPGSRQISAGQDKPRAADKPAEKPADKPATSPPINPSRSSTTRKRPTPTPRRRSKRSTSRRTSSSSTAAREASGR